MTKELLSKSKLEKTELKIAFIPIVCSTPLIYAHRHGFFKRNGLNVELVSAPGWSGVKQLMVYCDFDAAHLLSPMPLACNLGIDGKKADIRLSVIQNVNGQALTLAIKHLGIKDVRDMRGFTFGVPYRFSMHYYLLCYFLAANGINPLKEVNIKEVVPPRMPFYLEKGWVDGVFAPEPFNQIPVHRNIGFIHILSKDIWQGHPCCCFATTQNFIDQYPNTYKMMLRSVLEAELELHLADMKQKKIIAREISDPQHLNQDDPVPVEQALAGDFPDGKGGQHTIPDRIDFIPYPWMEYGSWTLSQMQRWAQLPGKVDYREVVESVFQTKDTFELAEALGFAREVKPRLKGVYPFIGKDPFSYMINQSYCAFKEKSEPLRRIELSKEARDHLSEIIKHMAYMAGGERKIGMEITTEGEIGQLQQIFNEMSLNKKFMEEAVIERNEELQKGISDRKKAEEELQKRTHDLDERVKELNCFYGISKLVENQNISLEEIIQGVADLIPLSWQYPEITSTRITLKDKTYKTNNFKETAWKQFSDIIVQDDRIGALEVCYQEERPEIDEGPFLKEERNLINAIAERLGKIIERKQIAQKLKETKDFSDNIIESSSDSIIVGDDKGYVVRVNKSFLKLIGYSVEEIIGKHTSELSIKDEGTYESTTGELVEIGEEFFNETKEIISRLFEEGKVPNWESYYMCRDKKVVPVEQSVVLLYDQEGNITGSVGINRDITERKKVELENVRLYEETRNTLEELKKTQSYLLQSEKMASIGQLAAGVAHEINNPTGFIHSNLGSLNKYSNKMLELLTRYEEGMASLKDNGSEEVSSFYEEMDELKKKLKMDFIMKDFQKVIADSLEGTSRIKKIVGDLKSFSRVDQEEFKHADINEGIETTLSVVWNELKYKCTLEKNYGDVPQIYCNLGQLNQVFVNLLINAAQAIEEKGVITISTRYLNEQSASSDKEQDCIEVKISDTGRGISEDKLNKIFEPFFTTKDVGKGTGLGLSIAYDIIQKHQGEITVQSEVGNGTTFLIRLPVVDHP